MIKYETKIKVTTDPKSKAKQSAPWVSYYHKLQALFGDDPSIDMNYTTDYDGNPIITMKVNEKKKHDALVKLLPIKKEWDNIILKIDIIYASELMGTTDILDAAFEGNPSYAFTKVVQSPLMSNPMTFVVFKKKVAQFFDDNLGDLNGNCNTLYQDLAREILPDLNGVFFCTDRHDSEE